MQRRVQHIAQICAACARVARGASTTRLFVASSPRRHQQFSQVAISEPRTKTDTRPRHKIPRSFSSTSAAATPTPETEAQRPDRRGSAGQDVKQTRPPSSEPDYYALFPQTLPSGPPPAGPFAIDTRALRREYLRLQAASHPDFHHAAGGSSVATEGAEVGGKEAANVATANKAHSPARRRAEAASSHINAAYKTLSSPLLRALYILDRQHGIDLAGDEAASLTRPDAQLLSDVMTAREEIDEAETEADLERPREENEQRIAECEKGLARAFAEGRVQDAVALTVRLKFWLSSRESIDNWEPGSPGVLQH